jgi:hypothetical protein
VPEVSSQEAAIEAVRAIVEWDDKVEADSGVLSLRVREVRRKL